MSLSPFQHKPQCRRQCDTKKTEIPFFLRPLSAGGGGFWFKVPLYVKDTTMASILSMPCQYYVDIFYGFEISFLIPFNRCFRCIKFWIVRYYYKQETWLTHQNRLGKNYAKCFALITETNLSRDDTNWIMMKMRRLAGVSQQSPTLVVRQAESFLKVTEVHLSFRLIISFITLPKLSKSSYTQTDESIYCDD